MLQHVHPSVSRSCAQLVCHTLFIDLVAKYCQTCIISSVCSLVVTDCVSFHSQATNVDFANRLYNSPEIAKSKRFSKPKLSQTGFTIDHYAGGVGYKTDNFLNKNKDFVVAEHQQLLQNSDQPFVCMLFPAEPQDTSDGNKVCRVGSLFW